MDAVLRELIGIIVILYVPHAILYVNPAIQLRLVLLVNLVIF